ncbi:hypothetical protein KUW17_18880 [Leisingera aquaemixtae]|uniref:hypothetical protein n=1 Tax=Leisingera aquaemixtae TaxID=1396826 RepID=UPI001C97A32F|nr:hypothetical protein [Leisingera aquaemixtae]MBY6068815.1 hypothetical protein [Leisingera aquaemixtae]
MLLEELSTFIDELPIPPSIKTTEALGAAETTPSIDTNNLPQGIVSGSTMIGFEPNLSEELRSSVALCLTAAQKVANTDSVASSPDLWVQRHQMVLEGLNWVTTAGGDVYTERSVSNIAVHKAIIPFLTAAFGPSAKAASLIITAIEQLQKIEEDKPWITLFERESRRFDISEFRFATAGMESGNVVLRFAAARFLAKQERLQILFFKKNDIDVRFKLASRTMTANPDLLESMNVKLKSKLEGATDDFISSLDF